MPGSQSVKFMWTGGRLWGSSIGAWACADRITASRNVQFASANYTVAYACHTRSEIACILGRLNSETEWTSYQAARKVYSQGPLVFSESEVGERVEAHPPGVVVRARERHGGGVVWWSETSQDDDSARAGTAPHQNRGNPGSGTRDALSSTLL